MIEPVIFEAHLRVVVDDGDDVEYEVVSALNGAEAVRLLGVGTVQLTSRVAVDVDLWSGDLHALRVTVPPLVPAPINDQTATVLRACLGESLVGELGDLHDRGEPDGVVDAERTTWWPELHRLALVETAARDAGWPVERMPSLWSVEAFGVRRGLPGVDLASSLTSLAADALTCLPAHLHDELPDSLRPAIVRLAARLLRETERTDGLLARGRDLAGAVDNETLSALAEDLGVVDARAESLVVLQEFPVVEVPVEQPQEQEQAAPNEAGVDLVGVSAGFFSALPALETDDAGIASVIALLGQAAGLLPEQSIEMGLGVRVRERVSGRVVAVAGFHREGRALRARLGVVPGRTQVAEVYRRGRASAPGAAAQAARSGRDALFDLSRGLSASNQRYRSAFVDSAAAAWRDAAAAWAIVGAEGLTERCRELARLCATAGDGDLEALAQAVPIRLVADGTAPAVAALFDDSVDAMIAALDDDEPGPEERLHRCRTASLLAFQVGSTLGGVRLRIAGERFALEHDQPVDADAMEDASWRAAEQGDPNLVGEALRVQRELLQSDLDHV